MKLRRWLPVLVLGASLGVAAGISACAEGELNPQPLPPGPDEPGHETKNGTDEPTSGATSGGSSSGGSSGFSATPDTSSDAAAAPDDAGDAGDAGVK